MKFKIKLIMSTINRILEGIINNWCKDIKIKKNSKIKNIKIKSNNILINKNKINKNWIFKNKTSKNKVNKK